jgi:hypothetical protein
MSETDNNSRSSVLVPFYKVSGGKTAHVRCILKSSLKIWFNILTWK